MKQYRSDDLIAHDSTIPIFCTKGLAHGAKHGHDFIEIVYADAVGFSSTAVLYRTCLHLTGVSFAELTSNR